MTYMNVATPRERWFLGAASRSENGLGHLRAGAGHTTGVSGEESDQAGAMPLIERSAIRRRGQEGRRKLRTNFRNGRRRSQEGQRQKGKIIGRTGARLVGRDRLGMGGGLRHTATHFVARTATTTATRRNRLLGATGGWLGHEHLRRQKHNAAKNGHGRFHRFNNSVTPTTASGKACGATWSPTPSTLLEP